MAKANDLTGHTYGRLTVLKRSENTKDGKAKWFCRCECGVAKSVAASELRKRRGGTKSCGCFQKEQAAKAKKTHGMSYHPAFAVWRAMNDRCRLPSHQAWRNYGGRGIGVCKRWEESFGNFWEDMGLGYKKGLTLDRIDVNGNYEIGNCRWATTHVQALNRRNAKIIKTPKGPMNVSVASKVYGINATTILYRIKNGWPENQLLMKADFTNRIRK